MTLRRLSRAYFLFLLLRLLVLGCSIASFAPHPAEARPAAETATPAEVPAPAERAPLVVHILDYVAVDYPGVVKDGRIVDQGEYDEQLEFVGRARALIAELPERPERAALAGNADRLLSLVKDKRPGEEVAALANSLRWEVIRAYQVAVAPRRPPDLTRAAALYAQQCAVCHGAEGRGDGPGAQGLDPKPANFHDRDRMAQRSVYGLYNTITLGVSGTGMASFRHLTEDERWGLAFHAAGLGREEADARRGAELWQAGRERDAFPDLASVVTRSAREIEAARGADAALVQTYLTAHPDALAARSGAIATSVARLRESVDAYRRGDGRKAQELATSSYLDGFELVEASLDAVDRDLRGAIEAEMQRYRSLLRDGAPVSDVEARAARIEAMLGQARQRLDSAALAPGAAMAAAFAIVLREGLEALLVVAAMYALLVRAGRVDAVKYVHAGWIAALALGGLTWLAASYLVGLSGASREVTEGLTALAATAILVYVGLWMHGKSNARRWQAYLQRQLQGALGGRTLWALALVSFLAVYREVFETVLFSEALAMQAGPDGRLWLIGGVAAAMAVLLVLGWLIVRGSARLPIGTFFRITSVVTGLLAIVLAGKGIAALQEAGWLPAHHVDLPSWPLVGLYPNLQALALQAALIVVMTAGVLYLRRTAARER